MNRTGKNVARFIRALAVFAPLLGVLAAQRAEAGPRIVLAIVVAKDASTTSVSKADLKHLFSGERVGSFVPFALSTSTREREVFDRVALGFTPEQAAAFWVDQKIRGVGHAPRSFPTPGHVVKAVTKVAGGIGYVPLQAVTPDVKVVKVDGKAPTDSGYPISG